MKSTRQTNKIKSRAVSVVICAILILCALLSFGLLQYPKIPSAAEEDTVENVNGIRFVQVAAGADFAIGLTYDGDLYGWSLNEDQQGGDVRSELNATLGTYYSSTPTKIDFKFMSGPVKDSDGTLTTEWGTGGSLNPDYHTPRTDDRIKKIVATRTTAAFITEKGYIYTWGKDIYEHDSTVDTFENVYSDDIRDRSTPHYILLRPTNDSTPWYSPYIINYSYYGLPAGNALIAAAPSDILGFELKDIAASEYGYIILFSDSTTTYTYSWGSLLYSAVNASYRTEYDYTFNNQYTLTEYMHGAGERRTVGIAISGNVPQSVVAGGYNFGINRATPIGGATSLQMRGRNFLTSQYDADNGFIKTMNVVTSESASAVTNIKYTGQSPEINVAGGVIGNNGQNIPGYIEISKMNVTRYYGTLNGTNLDFNDSDTLKVYDAHNNLLDKISDEEDAYNAYLYGVSLGNDVGYGIAPDGDTQGYLYAWGDNTYGQLGSNPGTGNYYKQSPVKVLSNVSGFVSVAAGKQLSANNKAFHSTSTLSITGDTVTGFNDNVKNDSSFVSGAITSDGKLYVWSNNHPVPRQLTYGDVVENKVQDSDKFVAVYSGYGNNLFAITKIGKLIRIQSNESGYSQKRYDNFTGVTNWTVDSSNTVAFAPSVVPDKEDTAPDLGKATFYVWNSTAQAKGEQTPELGTVTYNGGGESGNYKPLVDSNAIGDVYRILGISGDDDKLGEGDADGAFLSTIATADAVRPDDDGNKTFAPIFKYGTGEDLDSYVVMTADQQKNMFDVRFVNDVNGVGIEIKPSQSSKGYTIVMDFYVARYNSEVNFNTTKDDALYYDYKKCTIKFSIADTPTATVFEAFGEDGNSNIPLLDPNNAYNKYYSIALQDVSSGFDAIGEYFVKNGSSIASNDLVAAIIGNVGTPANDPGFPATSKITDGDLAYYLGESVAKAKYNNRYQWLFTDRDSDRITARADDGGMMSGVFSSGAVLGEIRKIDVSGIDTGLVADESLTVNDVSADFAKNFNNKYGIYGVTFALNSANDHITISFSYDIIRFTAVSTSGPLRYKDSNGVADYITDSTSDAQVNASILAGAYTTGYNSAYATVGNARDIAVIDTINIASVFSQASLRLSKNSYGVALENNRVVSGKAGSNTYTQEFTAHPDNANLSFVVGDTATIDLSRFFESRSNRMVFSYNGRATSDAYTSFNNLFYDQTGSGTQIVTLNDTRLVVRPTTAEPISIEVTAQRFASADDNSEVFVGDNEKIIMTFVFRNIVDFELNELANHTSTFLVTKTETIDIIAQNTRFLNVAGNGISAEKASELLSKVIITEPQAASADKFVVAKAAGSNTAITVTPKASGTGKVRFSATLYDKSLSFEITINVRKITLFNDPTDLITVVGDQYICVDEIKSKLAKSNEFGNNDSIDGYNVLTGDVLDASVSETSKIYNAIYFTTDPADTYENRVETPTFIRNVVFEGLTSDKPNIRIIANNSSVAVNTDYYMHVRFTNAMVDKYEDAPDGTIIEAVYIVNSGKMRVPVSININVKNLEASSADGITLKTSGSGLNSVITFSVSELLELTGTESPSQYSIVIIRSDRTTASYFNYSAAENNKSIRIEPVDNTPDVSDPENNPFGPELEVSVSNENGTRYLIITFNVSVDGILTKLPVMQGEDGVIGYGNIWIYSTLIVFGVLAIIFVIRFIVYWRKRAKQRAIIKRNQELIRMRDRIHAKGTAATREQMVKTRLKMDDPKYAKMLNEMRKNRQEEDGGVILENSDIAATTIDPKSKKKKKKKGGKKTVAELKAELEAKKAAFAAAQAQSAQPVDPFVQDVPMDGGAFDATGGDFVTPDGGFDAPGGDFGEAQSFDGSEIVFDATDMDDGV